MPAWSSGAVRGKRATELWDALAAGGGINWERLSCSRPRPDNSINKGSRSRPQTDVLSVSRGTVRQREQLAEDLSTGTRGRLNWIRNKVTWAARILEAPPRSHQFEGKCMCLMLDDYFVRIRADRWGQENIDMEDNIEKYCLTKGMKYQENWDTVSDLAITFRQCFSNAFVLITKLTFIEWWCKLLQWLSCICWQ